MEYYTLPQTNLKASKIALGCMRIASMSVEAVEELLLTSVKEGVNFFDHADIYGKGESEVVFGKALQKHPELRKDIIIQTKCAIRPGICFDFSKEYILESVAGSLERLQVEYIDILLLHRPDALMDPKEVAEAFNELYESGKVKYFGVSNQKPSQIELLKKYCKQPIIINQLQFGPAHTSMIDQGFYVNMRVPTAIDYDGAILDYCQLNDITIQAWSTIRETLDSETFIDNPEYPELNEALGSLGEKYGVSKIAIVTAWILRHPANIQPIAGTTSIKNLLDTLSAIDVKLTREEWYQIYTANRVLP